MEVYEIHGPRRLYWSSNMNELFLGMNFEKVMVCKRFERIIAFLQLSGVTGADQQVLDFVADVNDNFQKSVSPGSFLTLDESMVNSFHHSLKGKIKIIRKPTPIGNEIKIMADGLSNIVLNMELYEGTDLMKNKDHVQEYGATTATTLCLIRPYHGSGRRVVADSWSSSVKSAVELRKRGLFSIMLVKTAHKNFPRTLLGEACLQRGEW